MAEVQSKDNYGRTILTVKQLREILDRCDPETHVVIATDGWYVNIGSASFPQAGGGDDQDWACLTLFPGTEFDSRQF